MKMTSYIYAFKYGGVFTRKIREIYVRLLTRKRSTFDVKGSLSDLWLYS